MKKTIGKVLSVLIVISLILSQMAMLSFATEPEIVSFTAVAQNDLIENYNGWYTTDWIWDEELQTSIESEEYFYYGVYDADIEFTVEYADGRICQGSEEYIYEETGERISVYGSQSYENQWGVGTYQVPVEFCGVETTVEIEVVENPIESISAVAQKELIENYDGWYTTDCIWDEELQTSVETEEYFYYNIQDADIEYTVVYKDDRVFQGDEYEILEQTGYGIMVSDGQSYDRQWVVGTQEIGVSFLGFETTAKINVVEHPVKSITVKQGRDLEEGIHGYYRTDYLHDEDGNFIGKSDVYFRYDVYAADLEYIIEYKDGTILQGSEYDIYKETGREIELSSTQNNEKQWSVGTNPLNVSFMGIETTAQIKVVENSVDRVIVEDEKYIENADGYWNYENDEAYFYYDKTPSYTVVMKDGTRYESLYDGYADIGDYDIYPYIETDQSYDNQWGVGKHSAKMYLAGKEVEFVAEVVETPIENMTVTPIRDLISGIDNSDYIGYLDFNVEIKFKDGTTDKCLASDLGYKYGYLFEMVESEDATGVGHFSFIGYEGEYEFKFIENPYESIEISGTDELTIKFNRLDGTSETAKAIDYEWRMGDVGFDGGYIITDKGAYPVGMRYLFDENEGAEYPNKDVTFVIGEMESNTLETNNWYLTLSKSKDYFREIGYYKGLSGDKFSGIDATSANANVTDLIGIAIQVLQYEYEWEFVEEIVDGVYYCYGIYNVDDVVEMVDRVFGISNVDYTKHPGYNSKDGTIKVPEIAGFGDDGGEFFKITYNEVFENGKWTITKTFYSYYDATVTTTLILNEKGQIEKISYFKDIAGWTLENGKWAYYENGAKVTNQWKKDSKGWCYLGADGYMATNKWIRDSVGWCYVGADGYCVTNQWVKDSHGWCYLDSNGRMATNKWIRDSVGWCYVGADGYCVTNKWVKDSHGWCYLDSNGRMATNKWIRDSVGWCYVGADGYCVTNKWVKDSHGWCYLDAQGRMMTNSWLQWNGNWYYLDENGYMVTGTKVINGKTYKFASNGVWIG